MFLKPVKELFETCESLFAGPGESAMALPSARVALRLQQFMNRAGVENVRCHDLNAMGVRVSFKSSSFRLRSCYVRFVSVIVHSDTL